MDATIEKFTKKNISSGKVSKVIKRVDFGVYRYFPDSRKLMTGGSIQKLPPTPAAALELLIEKQGELILRQEIVESAWPGRKEVSEANFYQVIKRLRKALDDTSEPRKVIINPSKNAYALRPNAVIHYHKTRNDKHNVVWVALTLLILAVSCIVTYYKWSATEKIARYKATDYNAITTLRGHIKRSVLSPDGSIVVFTHQAPGSIGWSLMAKRMKTEEYSTLVPFTNSMHNNEPSFSPSGRQLAWVANDHKTKANCGIMIADFNTEDMSLSNQRTAIDCSMAFYGRTPQWKTENTLLVSLPSKQAKPSGIVEFDLSTREQFAITAPQGNGYGDYGLFYNRSAQKLAYIRQSSSSGTGIDLRIYDLESKKHTSLKTYTHPIYTVVWVNDHMLLTNGSDGFEVVSLEGQSFPIFSESIEPEYFPFFMGLNQIGFVKGGIYGRDINVIDLNKETSDTHLSSISHDYRPVISKNTGEFSFVSMRNGKRQIFNTINQVPTQVTHFKGQEYISDIAISPNGNSIAFSGINKLTILNKQGKVLYQRSYSVKGLSFTPDGESLLFGVTSEDAQLIKRLNLSDYSESTVTDGFMPKVDEEGDIYFFRTFHNSKNPVLHKMTRQGGVIVLFDAPFQLVNSNSFDIINNQLFYVIRDESEELMLVSENLSTRKITLVTAVTDSKLSLNKDATKLVTSQKGVVQNNLASFRLVQEKSTDTP